MTSPLNSFSPFKCPVCSSPYFGPVWEKEQHVGRFCKGWPSGFDRSYIPCKGKHEERFSEIVPELRRNKP